MHRSAYQTMKNGENDIGISYILHLVFSEIARRAFYESGVCLPQDSLGALSLNTLFYSESINEGLKIPKMNDGKICP